MAWKNSVIIFICLMMNTMNLLSQTLESHDYYYRVNDTLIHFQGTDKGKYWDFDEDGYFVGRILTKECNGISNIFYGSGWYWYHLNERPLHYWGGELWSIGCKSAIAVPQVHHRVFNFLIFDYSKKNKINKNYLEYDDYSELRVTPRKVKYLYNNPEYPLYYFKYWHGFRLYRKTRVEITFCPKIGIISTKVYKIRPNKPYTKLKVIFFNPQKVMDIKLERLDSMSLEEAVNTGRCFTPFCTIDTDGCSCRHVFRYTTY